MGETANDQGPPNEGQDLESLLAVILSVLLAHSPELRRILRQLSLQHLLTQEERESIFAWTHGLNENELYVAILIARITKNEKIAETLDVGVKRVDQIIKSLKRKLGVKARDEIILLAERAGLLQE